MSRLFSLYCPEKSRAQEHMVGQCNINEIMDRVRRTRKLPETEGQALAIYADVSEVGDFQQLQNRVRAAEEMFSGLPGKIREKFKNNAGAFMDFVAEEKNRPDLVKMGLANEEEVPAKTDKVDVEGLTKKLSIKELRAALAAREKEEPEVPAKAQ